MKLLQLLGFGFKAGNLVLILCCWFLNLIYMNWIVNDRSMRVKKGFSCEGRQLWVKVWEKITSSSTSFKIHHHCSQYIEPKRVRKTWWRKLLWAWILFSIFASIWFSWYITSQAMEKRKETLASMCEERARMLQDQFNVHVNHIQAISMLISIFHHSKNTSAIDQMTFARYTERTVFERPLTSGVAYAVRVLHSERDHFEKQQGWNIKRMDSIEQTPVHNDESISEVSERSPVQEEYAPVIFAQDTIAHVISLDMLSGKEDRENILRARESGKGVLTAPFRLIKSNRLGVILTFAVYKTDLSSTATLEERTKATDGYLGGVFDVESLVEKLLQQLASKQTILVNVYDMTDISNPISMYGSNVSNEGLLHISNLNFGDPFRKHEMHCRFKQKPPFPWLAISGSIGILIIGLLTGQIFHATMNRIAKVEDDYHEMMELKKRAQAADAAKSQFLATVSHEIRTPMNGVLGMLHMLMDTDLDVTQQDYVTTAQASGRALVSLINEVLDQAKIESGKLELEDVQFDLRGILDDVLSLFSVKSQEKGVELAVYISDKVPEMVIGDPGRFRQIITNLMGNSIKFTEKGHIFVTVHLVDEVAGSTEETESSSSNTLSGFPVADRRQSWVKFKAFDREEGQSDFPPSSPDQVNIIVSVEDTGSGIPLAAQSRIFTPFMQVGPSISRIHGGTGIGLSISKCLVQLMQGEIGFVSVPKVGSTFTFTAVLRNGYVCNNPDELQILQINKKRKPVSSEFQGMRALVIDPRPVRSNVSKYHIQRLGIHVEVFPDMNHALSTFINTDHALPDMVIIEQEVWDMEMDQSNLFIRKLNTIKQNHIPKLFLLANPIKCNRSSVSAGSVVSSPAIVMKPLRASMLAASLQRALGVGAGGNYRNGSLRNLTLSSLLHGRKILVVDDNKVNLKVAEGFLKKYGAQVVRVESGHEAISLLQPPHLFDACFMDIQMPEMDGFEATRRIRKIESEMNNNQHKSREVSVESNGNVPKWHVPILAMTADVIQATNEECQKSGMDGYLSKPFDAEQLYREVSRFFETAPKQS